MSAGSGGGNAASQPSSHVTLTTESGGPRVEVDAVMTGTQQGAGPIKTTISQARVEYGVPNSPGAGPSGSSNAYPAYSPYAMYYPAYNQTPTTSSSATSNQSTPCKIHGPGSPYAYSMYAQNPYANYNYQALQAAASPGGSNAIAPGAMAISSTSTGPAAQAVKQEKRVIKEMGVEVIEEYLNDELVSRTINGVPQPITKK